MGIKSICGVILISENPAALARFYSEAFALEFEREDHGDLADHFGVDIGRVHFGIHPPSNFGKTTPGNAATALAFEVDSLEETIAKLEDLGAEQVREPHDEGFGPVAAYLDPDRNQFEVVELSYEFE